MNVARRSLRRAAQENAGVQINPAMIDVEGSDINLIFLAAAMMGETIVAGFAECMISLLLEKATGEKLDQLAYDRCFGATRKGANAASVFLTMTRPTAGAGQGVLAAGTTITTVANNLFTLQNDVPFAVGQLSAGPSGVVAIATLVGPDQNVAENTLTRFQDAVFDPTITVTNSLNPDGTLAKAAGGTDRESDVKFRARLRSFFLTLRRATAAAVQFGARQVEGVSVATSFEIVNPGTALPAGAGEVVIGDDNGNAGPQMIQDTKDELLQWRPIGIPVFVSGGTVVFEPVILRLEYLTGIDTVKAQAQARATVVAVSQFLASGATLERSLIASALRIVPGVVVKNDAVVAPTGDVDPTSRQQAIRVRPEDVSFV